MQQLFFPLEYVETACKLKCREGAGRKEGGRKQQKERPTIWWGKKVTLKGNLKKVALQVTEKGSLRENILTGSFKGDLCNLKQNLAGDLKCISKERALKR